MNVSQLYIIYVLHMKYLIPTTNMKMVHNIFSGTIIYCAMHAPHAVNEMIAFIFDL